LPFGTSEAVIKGLEQLRFKPAARNGKPLAVKMFFDYIITATYGEFDKASAKPKIIDKLPQFTRKPESRKTKGKVM
jgi:hypothetical protein